MGTIERRGFFCQRRREASIQATGANITAAVIATGSVMTYNVLSIQPRERPSRAVRLGADAGVGRLTGATAVQPRFEFGGGTGEDVALAAASER